MSRLQKISKKQKPVAFRRKREGKTDYRKRLRLLLADKPRVVFRRSLRYIWLQLVHFDEKGDTVSVSAHSKELQKLGWKGSCNNIPAAYLTGLLFAKKAKEASIDAVADNGLYPTVAQSCFCAVLKGVVDGGMKVPASEKVFPSEERIKGEHIKKYAEELKKGEGFGKQFSSEDALKITDNFDEVKKKIA